VPRYGYAFFDKDILEMIWARALIGEGRLGEARSFVFEMLQKRDRRGLWGWSTQKNVQAILTLAKWLEALGLEQDKVSCEVKVGDKVKKVEFWQGKEVNFSFSDTQKLKASASCSDVVMVDWKAKWLPKVLKP